MFNQFWVYFCVWCSNIILLHVTVQLSQHPLLKSLSFLHCILLPSLSQIKLLNDHRYVGLPLGFLSNSIDLYFCFCYSNIVFSFVALYYVWGLPWWLSVVKNLLANAGDMGSIIGWEDPMEKEMATHSSILAWEIPWIQNPGWYSPQGCKLVRQDIVTKQI